MILTAFLIWLYLTLIDVFTVMLAIAATFILISFFYLMIDVPMSYSSSENVARYAAVKGWIFATAKKAKFWVFFAIIGCTIYPSNDDLKFIIGGSLAVGAIQAATDIDGVDKLPANVVNAINSFLEGIAAVDPTEEPVTSAPTAPSVAPTSVTASAAVSSQTVTQTLNDAVASGAKTIVSDVTKNAVPLVTTEANKLIDSMNTVPTTPAQ